MSAVPYVDQEVYTKVTQAMIVAQGATGSMKECTQLTQRVNNIQCTEDAGKINVRMGSIYHPYGYSAAVEVQGHGCTIA